MPNVRIALLSSLFFLLCAPRAARAEIVQQGVLTFKRAGTETPLNLEFRLEVTDQSSGKISLRERALGYDRIIPLRAQSFANSSIYESYDADVPPIVRVDVGKIWSRPAIQKFVFRDFNEVSGGIGGATWQLREADVLDEANRGRLRLGKAAGSTKIPWLPPSLLFPPIRDEAWFAYLKKEVGDLMPPYSPKLADNLVEFAENAKLDETPRTQAHSILVRWFETSDSAAIVAINEIARYANPDLGRVAIWRLSELARPGDRSAVPGLIFGLVREPDLATAGLVKIGAAAVPELRDTLRRDPPAFLLIPVLEALAKIEGGEAAIDDLIPMLNGPRVDRKLAAVITLAKFGEKAKAALPQLYELALTAPELQLRVTAVNAIGKLGKNQRSVETLRKVLDRKRDPDVKSQAKAALENWDLE